MKLLLISAAVLACTFAAPQGSAEDDGEVVGEGVSNVQYRYYLHNTPEEEEVERVVPRFITPPNLQRNKVIFVKVPPFVPKAQGPIDLPAKIIDKTIVYVLVKKERDPEPIRITTEAPRKPEPPVVHVVKYADDTDLDNKIIKGVSNSKLYGKTVFTEDDVNAQLERVKEVTELKIVPSSAGGSSAASLPSSIFGSPARLAGGDSPARGQTAQSSSVAAQEEEDAEENEDDYE